MDIERARFPTAGRLLRFIKAARESQDSILGRLTDFYDLATQETAGPWWKSYHDVGSRAAANRRPMSPLGEAIRVYHPHLIGEALVPTVEPSGLGTRSSARMLEYSLRQWADDAQYALHDERAVLDAMLAIGIIYVFRREGGMAVATQDGTLDAGQPGVARVGIRQMVVDPLADTWQNATGIGHYFEVDRQTMLAQGIGDPNVLERLPNVWEDMDETRRSRRRDTGDSDQYIDDKVLLWEFCFNHQGRRFCCTLPPTSGDDRFVVEPYELTDEPEGSRYIVTSLNQMPESLMPVSPAMVLMDSHLARVANIAKIMEQAETIERKYIIRPGAQDLVMRLRDKGGDGYVVGDPQSISEFILGGMVKELLDVEGVLRDMGQVTGPNTQLAGGQQEPGTTATSNSILAGNASVVMGAWKRKIEEGRTAVLRRVAAMLLQNGDIQTFPFVASSGVTYPLSWRANTQDISYDQYRYTIKSSSPSSGMDTRAKLRSLFEILTAVPQALQVLVGMLGADPAKVMRVIGDMAQMPQLEEMVPTQDSQQLQSRILNAMTQSGHFQPAVASPPQRAGPETKVGQMNADLAPAIPA